MMRSMLVLDGDNHFEGYTNSDGVEFDGGLSSLACTPPPTHAHKPASPLFLCAANSCACCMLRAPLPSLAVSGRRVSSIRPNTFHSIPPELIRCLCARRESNAALIRAHERVHDRRQGGFEIVDSYEGPGTWYSAEDGFGSQRSVALLTSRPRASASSCILARTFALVFIAEIRYRVFY